MTAMLLAVYPDHQALEKNLAQYPSGGPKRILFGYRWAVFADADTVDVLRKHLGGSVR